MWFLLLLIVSVTLSACGSDEQTDEERIRDVAAETDDLLYAPDEEDCDLFVNVGHYPNDDYSRQELKTMADESARQCHEAVDAGEDILDTSIAPLDRAALNLEDKLPGSPYDDAEVEIKGDHATLRVQYEHGGALKTYPMELVQVDDGDWRRFIAID